MAVPRSLVVVSQILQNDTECCVEGSVGQKL